MPTTAIPAATPNDAATFTANDRSSAGKTLRGLTNPNLKRCLRHRRKFWEAWSRHSYTTSRRTKAPGAGKSDSSFRRELAVDRVPPMAAAHSCATEPPPALSSCNRRRSTFASPKDAKNFTCHRKRRFGVTVNGDGVIGKRVAEAITFQEAMIFVHRADVRAD